MKKGVRKSNSKGIHIHLTNRWLYTLIAVGILAIVGVVIYADAPSSTIPNPGHPISDLQTCNTAGDVLQINSTGQWSCVAASSLSSSQWIASGSNIYYSGGNVGIGTSSPSYRLTVGGSLYANSVYTGAVYANNIPQYRGSSSSVGSTYLSMCTLPGSNFNGAPFYGCTCGTAYYFACDGTCSSTSPLGTCPVTNVQVISSCGYQGQNNYYSYQCAGSTYNVCGTPPSTCTNPYGTSICGTANFNPNSCNCGSYGTCYFAGNLVQ